MGISLSKAFGTRKILRKVFGKGRGTWGYFRKKVGLKNPFSSKASIHSAGSYDSIYGPSGSIVGRF